MVNTTKTKKRIRTNNKPTVDADAERRQRVEQCQGELNVVLTKYRCGIEPVVVITTKGVQCSVRIFPVDPQPPAHPR